MIENGIRMNVPAASRLPGPTFPRVFPFAVYMGFVALGEVGDITGIMPHTPEGLALVYPAKAVCTALALVWCLPRCPEVRFAHLRAYKDTALSILAGLFVFAFWIHLDVDWARLGTSTPFAHEAAGTGVPRAALLICRFLGAAVVVPLAEELFWRSWLIRAVLAKDFASVPLNRFSWFAFLSVNVLFALEHHMVLAGFLAGATYTLLLYRTNSVTQCVLAHAVTNAALAAWVMFTGNWDFL